MAHVPHTHTARPKQVSHAAKADIRGPGSKTLPQEEAGNHWKVRAQHSAGAWTGDTIGEQLEALGVLRAGSRMTTSNSFVRTKAPSGWELGLGLLIQAQGFSPFSPLSLPRPHKT